MRVLQIVKTNDGATWAFNQAKKLSEMGVEIICMLPHTKGGMAVKYKENGMNVIQFDASLPLGNPLEFIKRKKNL